MALMYLTASAQFTHKISAEQQSQGPGSKSILAALRSYWRFVFFVKINLKTSSSELWLSLTYVMDEVSYHEAFKGSGITLGAYSVQWYCVGGSQSGAG